MASKSILKKSSMAATRAGDASDDTLLMYAAVMANFVTHPGNTVAQVVVPSGSSTSISPDSPMSTITSPEAKRHCGDSAGGVDALPGFEGLPKLPFHQAEPAIAAVFSGITTTLQA